MILKIMVCILIGVIFWSALITGNPFSSIVYLENKYYSYQYDKLPIIKYQNITYNLTDKFIILRMDDVQGFLWRDITIKLTDTILENNMSITLAVIPDRALNKDIKIKNYLIKRSRDNRVEIAQHGYTHSENEFLYVNKSEAERLIFLGYSEIIESLKVKPITFIPPYNVYNKNTTIALSNLNFKFISSDRNETGKEYNLTLLGYDATTKETDSDELTPIEEIINKCNKSLSDKNVCVIMIHLQDYSNKDGTLNKTEYSQFVNLLDELKKLNATSITFKDLK